jgi:hydrogenase maturation protease
MRITVDTEKRSCWIIAYGNTQRGDDGIGPYVAQILEQHLGALPSVGVACLPQLDLALLEEIQGADQLIFVDACVEELKDGVRWSQAAPELNGWALGAHHLTPDIFLGLLSLLYDRKPVSWVVSVQGLQFELGETLDPQTRGFAQRAAAQIMDWLFMNSIALPATLRAAR